MREILGVAMLVLGACGGDGLGKVSGTVGSVDSVDYGVDFTNQLVVARHVYYPDVDQTIMNDEIVVVLGPEPGDCDAVRFVAGSGYPRLAVHAGEQLVVFENYVWAGLKRMAGDTAGLHDGVTFDLAHVWMPGDYAIDTGLVTVLTADDACNVQAVTSIGGTARTGLVHDHLTPVIASGSFDAQMGDAAKYHVTGNFDGIVECPDSTPALEVDPTSCQY